MKLAEGGHRFREVKPEDGIEISCGRPQISGGQTEEGRRFREVKLAERTGIGHRGRGRSLARPAPACAGMRRKVCDSSRLIQSTPRSKAWMDFAIWMGLVDGCFVGTIRTNTNHPGALWKCKAWMDRRLFVLFDPSRPIHGLWKSTLGVDFHRAWMGEVLDGSLNRFTFGYASWMGHG